VTLCRQGDLVQTGRPCANRATLCRQGKLVQTGQACADRASLCPMRKFSHVPEEWAVANTLQLVNMKDMQ